MISTLKICKMTWVGKLQNDLGWISLEVTNEGSIFYTWKKNDISLYLDHYLVDEYDGKDEAIISIYKNNDKLVDFAGSLDEAIIRINNALGSESIVFPAFA